MAHTHWTLDQEKAGKTMKSAAVMASLLATGFLLAGPSQAQVSSAPPEEAPEPSIIEDPEIRETRDEDIDPNQDLIDALRRAARQGPRFLLSPQEVSLTMETGQRRSANLRITNAGDEMGQISGINLIGSVEGLDLSTTCDGGLPQGDFCQVTITYGSETAGTVRTAVVGTINEPDRTNFQVPVTVFVQDPPPPEEPRRPVVRQQPRMAPQPVAPPARDIARNYFLSLTPPVMPGSQGDMVVVSAEETPVEVSVAGVPYDEIRTARVRTDERYDPDLVPWTETSLPVDRDRILTTDRVIKAVLETPVSNVLCSKVVAMVESDVYSATSARPLIPAGSRAVGECREFVGERAGIAWDRIITTDGRSISFQDRVADTRDASGLGGSPGRVYMSPFDKYVLPVFSTLIDATAGAIFASFGENEEVVVDNEGGTIRQETSATNEGLRIITEDARQTAQQIIGDIRDPREVTVIPKGTRIDIEIMEDIYFREDREVVFLDDLRYDLEHMDPGRAERDVPERLVLSPMSPNESGGAVVVDGQRYRIEQQSETDVESTSPPAEDPVMRDLREMEGETTSP